MQILCGNSTCNKPITNKTEVEYSAELSEFYCNYNCAVDRFFDYMRCTPFQFEEHEMKEREVVLKRRKLYWKDNLSK